MTMFWRRTLTFCGKCKTQVDAVSAGYDHMVGCVAYAVKCHGEEIVFNADDQELYRVNGPIQDTYLLWPNGHKRVTRKFKLKGYPFEWKNVWTPLS